MNPPASTEQEDLLLARLEEAFEEIRQAQGLTVLVVAATTPEGTSVPLALFSPSAGSKSEAFAKAFTLAYQRAGEEVFGAATDIHGVEWLATQAMHRLEDLMADEPVQAVITIAVRADGRVKVASAGTTTLEEISAAIAEAAEGIESARPTRHAKKSTEAS